MAKHRYRINNIYLLVPKLYKMLLYFNQGQDLSNRKVIVEKNKVF